MFQGFSQGAVDFLWGVRFNNERSWFEAHKQEYLDLVIAPLQELGRQVHAAMTAAYPKAEPLCLPHLPGCTAAPRPRPLQGPPVVHHPARAGGVDPCPRLLF